MRRCDLLFCILFSPGAALAPFSLLRERHVRTKRESLSSLLFGVAASAANIDNTSVGAETLPGADPNRPNKVNQDAYFSSTAVDPAEGISYRVVGVLDGHGKRAETLTSFLSHHLPLCIQEQLNRPSKIIDLEEQIERLGNFRLDSSSNDDSALTTVPKVLQNAFHQAHWDAMQNTKVPAGRCGTTCVVCMWSLDQQGSPLHVAHVGDSRVYRFPNAQPLSTPTTVQLQPLERCRIESGEGRIDDNGNVWYGPVGISMTRALGDAVMLRAGVVPTPIVETFPRLLDGAANRLVLATDGVWDVVSAEELEQRHGDKLLEAPVQQAASLIVDLAKKGWQMDGPRLSLDEESRDDITCVVVDM